jgi:predicted metal-dependent enzyme (double-stranded beta helix superfamily)
LEKERLAQKQDELSLLFQLNPDEATRIKGKKELLKRLTHIEHLAKQKNYVEIEKLLKEKYV